MSSQPFQDFCVQMGEGNQETRKHFPGIRTRNYFPSFQFFETTEEGITGKLRNQAIKPRYFLPVFKIFETRGNQEIKKPGKIYFPVFQNQETFFPSFQFFCKWERGVIGKPFSKQNTHVLFTPLAGKNMPHGETNINTVLLVTWCGQKSLEGGGSFIFVGATFSWCFVPKSDWNERRE